LRCAARRGAARNNHRGSDLQDNPRWRTPARIQRSGRTGPRRGLARLSARPTPSTTVAALPTQTRCRPSEWS